jgi:hypothetical protein
MPVDLYFYTGNTYFPEGTLLPLGEKTVGEDGKAHFELPDRGDGSGSTIPLNELIPCPPFAENVPPGRCPIRVTSFVSETIKPATALPQVESNLHFQRIILTIEENIGSLGPAVIIDRLNGTEVERYETLPIEEINGRPSLGIHIGHLGPGFYAASIEIDGKTPFRLTFIKQFPPEFESRYLAVARNTHKTATAQRPTESMPVNLFHSHPDAPAPKFPADLLNNALELVTEWGENFRKPIAERLPRRYPDLSPGEIEQIEKLVKEAENHIYGLAESELAGKLTENEIVPTALARFPWLDSGQAVRLKNIGMFYARK